MNIINKLLLTSDTLKYLEAGKVKTAVFYSEAVVTGEQELYDVFASDGDKLRLLKLAVSLTQKTSFAFADAIQKAALKMEISTLSVASQTVGSGVVGEIEEEKYFLGNKRFIKEQGVIIPYAIRHTDFSGYTVIYLARCKEFLGLLLFCEEVSEKAVGAINFFRNIGIRTVVLGHEKGLKLLKKRTAADEIRIAILGAKREKVLQELKNGGKITVIKEPSDIQKCVDLCFYGGRLLHLRRVSIIVASVLLVFSVLFLSLPMLSMLFAVNTFAFMLYSSITLRHIRPDVPYITEEKMMFGKVKYTMSISGMSCAHCSAHVKSALESIRGVSAEISLEEKVARIKCPASLDTDKLTKAVSDAGYTVNSVERV